MGVKVIVVIYRGVDSVVGGRGGGRGRILGSLVFWC